MVSGMIAPIITNQTTCPDNVLIRVLVRKGHVQLVGGAHS